MPMIVMVECQTANTNMRGALGNDAGENLHGPNRHLEVDRLGLEKNSTHSKRRHAA
ncbi:MAG: hypothetical protein SFV23_15325 [Planctomycetaceae bacterium]|nr:hypothetical protein [Planctomycetaceae bacterium]